MSDASVSSVLSSDKGLCAVRFGRFRVVLEIPASIGPDLTLLFGPIEAAWGESPDLKVALTADGRFEISGIGDTLTGLSRPEIFAHIVDRVIRGLIAEDTTGLALHAALVGNASGCILIAGATGAGKSSVAAWFTANGFDFWTDELVVVAAGTQVPLPLGRALVAKTGSVPLITQMEPFAAAPYVDMALGRAIRPPQAQSAPSDRIRLVVLPHYQAGAELSMRVLSNGAAAFSLMAANLNARNFPDGGLATIAATLAEAVCLDVTYGDVSQLDAGLADIARAALLGRFDAGAAQALIRIAATKSVAPPPAEKSYPVPAATPVGRPRRLTIAMTTYDDFDGVYFSIQSMRLFHGDAIGDAEFLVVDNNPDGIASSALKDMEKAIPNYRYYPYMARRGTIVRDHVFEIATGEFVLCMDCHVMFVPGAMARLMRYFDENPTTRDLLQGPLIYDRLDHVSTHFEPKWSSGMWGQWATDPRGVDPDAPPFDIPMQGVGALACRRDAWPGYNPLFRGFGAEEGYIHEKFRQGGARTLCLPFFRWLHRFYRPRGVSYPNRWEDRVFNYIAGFNELGLPVDDVIDHYRTLLGESVADRIVDDVWRELRAAGVPIGAGRARQPALPEA